MTSERLAVAGNPHINTQDEVQNSSSVEKPPVHQVNSREPLRRPSGGSSTQAKVLLQHADTGVAVLGFLNSGLMSIFALFEITFCFEFM